MLTPSLAVLVAHVVRNGMFYWYDRQADLSIYLYNCTWQTWRLCSDALATEAAACVETVSAPSCVACSTALELERFQPALSLA